MIKQRFLIIKQLENEVTMKKILTFIKNKNNELLLLHNNPVNPIHGGDIWYTVTGGVEEYDNSLEDTVKREIKEETNLDVIDTKYLNINYKYTSRRGIECTEYVFISLVKDGNIILNEESIEYKWLSINDYIKEIHWYGNKEELRNLLEKTLIK